MQIPKTLFIVLILLSCALLFAAVFEFTRLNEISARIDGLQALQKADRPETPRKTAPKPADDSRYDELYEWYFNLSTELEIIKGQINSLQQAPANYGAETGAENTAETPHAQAPAPELAALQEKLEHVEQTISKIEQGPSYLTPSDRIALKAEVENILQSKEKEEDEQRYAQLKTRVFDSLAEDLSLTDTQKEQVTKIIDQRFLEAAKIRETAGGRGNRQEAQQKWAELATSTDEEMARILDAAQMEKFAQWKSERPWWVSSGRQQGR